MSKNVNLNIRFIQQNLFRKFQNQNFGQKLLFRDIQFQKTATLLCAVYTLHRILHFTTYLCRDFAVVDDSKIYSITEVPSVKIM